MSEYVKPEFKKDAFNCPHCGVYAGMSWNILAVMNTTTTKMGEYIFYRAICFHCSRVTIWYVKGKEPRMFFPRETAIPPEANMPEKVKEIYEEASLVLGDSPRASCALLRLALQELMIYLRDNYQEYSDLKGKKIDDDIGILVKNHNLSAKIQKALDVVRITGNNAVHPKELDINDDPEIAERLFEMINLIVEGMITKPKEVEELFEKMPQGAKDAISKRDQ